MNNYSAFKEESISSRYITNDAIFPLLNNLSNKFKVSVLGQSVNQNDIYKVEIGSGETKLLMWSQMHGNESTATKALFDVFNYLDTHQELLKHFKIVVVPILNPDGAKAYTRLNANDIDLNRDFRRLSQPESIALMQLFIDFKPDYCFNLHDQRTIFSAGNTNKSATLSFLSPSVDEECTLTLVRKKAMEVIAAMNSYLQQFIPNQVGRYDDAFNINCVGDTFQTKGVPTILFEAGHYSSDYQREKTRELVFVSIVKALEHISTTPVSGDNFSEYFDIPENQKLFYDIIIRNARLSETSTEIHDIAIQFVEKLNGNQLNFIPKVEKISNLSTYYAHLEVDANNSVVLGSNNTMLTIGSENDFVLMNDEKLLLKP